MSDLEQRIVELLHLRQLASLATVCDEGKPWVRYVAIQGGPGVQIRFATFTEARKVTQIRGNPEVHLTCGISDPFEPTPYLQIQARARVATDRDERHGFWHPLLRPIFDGPDDPRLAIVVIDPYRIEYWVPPERRPEVWEADTGSDHGGP